MPPQELYLIPSVITHMTSDFPPNRSLCATLCESEGGHSNQWLSHCSLYITSLSHTYSVGPTLIETPLVKEYNELDPA